jgi:ATP-dependent DNA helicase RecQ
VPYHAGLASEERSKNQDAFARDEIDVVVATVAFGMGIDKSNVRFVVHRDMPRSVEAWYQEIGRAGRDGLDSDCIVMYSWADVMGYDHFLSDIEDDELREETRRKTIELFELLESGSCRHRAVVGYFDESMEDCGESCDVCSGMGLEAVLPANVAVRKRAAAKIGTGAPFSATAAATPGLSGEGYALFERLRSLRKRLADAEKVPAYIVFNDAVLRQMVDSRPSSSAELLALSGVGPAKLKRYGAAFLVEIAEAS